MTYGEWVKSVERGVTINPEMAFAAGAASRDAEIAELVAALEHFYSAWAAGRNSVDVTAIRIAKQHSPK